MRLGRLCLIWLTWISLPLSAQDIQIRLLDATSRSPIESAVISHENEVFVSNAEGYVEIPTQITGRLVISHLGYESVVVNISSLGGEVSEIHLIPKTVLLREVEVKGFDNQQRLRDNAGAISYLSKQDIVRLDQGSLLTGMNSIPGMRMEERSPGSYRISVRGSQLRSPFGVRNVKVYWNEIPLSGPTGNTPLNLLSVSNVGSAEVIRGPAGSIFGAGMGGVVVLKTEPAISSQRQIETDLVVGSYDAIRWATRYRGGYPNSSVFADFTLQQTEGYRDHSRMDRRTFQVFSEMKTNSSSSVAVNLFYSDLFYQIPGGLTEAQRDQDPTMARPGSSAQNASIDTQSARLGISYTKDWEQVDNTTSLFLFSTQFENPFITDYKRELQTGFGGRTRFGWDGQLGSLPFLLTTGVEGQFYASSAQNFGNQNGVADTLRFSDDIRTAQYFLFVQGELVVTPSSRLIMGLSLNGLDYDIDRSVDNISGVPSRFERTLDPVWAPRIGWVQELSDNASTHASISYGFSPPTILEVRTNEGSINEDLRPETGINYEVGTRVSWTPFQIDLSAFYFNLDNAITSEASPSGVVLFDNAGSTNQYGIELKIDHVLFLPANFLRESRLGLNYTLHYFQFNQYEKLGNDFSGNWLTGTPRNLVFATWDLESGPGIYLTTVYNYTDRIPLNDANDVYSREFHLLNFRLGLRRTVGGSWQFDLYTGIDNALNQQYSRGNDLNAFGGRYFQPAPGANYYGGLKLAYNF